MKKNLKSRTNIISVFLLLSISLFFTVSCDKKREIANTVKEEYTCPMHPEIVKNEPASCPICGMDLVKKATHREEVEITEDLNFLLQPSDATVVGSIKTVAPTKDYKEVTIEANGIISYDTRQLNSIPIRFGGRIEKLYVQYNFQPIHKGQKLLEIYSPDLVTAQKQLLYLLSSDSDNEALINAAKKKLRLLGVSESQIKQLVSTQKEQYSFPVYSFYDGYVVESEIAPSGIAPPGPEKSSSMGSEGGMGSMTGGSNNAASVTNSPLQQDLSIREGMYVNANQALFKVISTSTVLAEFNLYPEDAARVKKGDSVTVIINGKEIDATVGLIQPFFDKGENFMKVRVYLKGKASDAKIGQLANARLKSTVENALWVPELAVYDLGTKRIVFVSDGKIFKPREVVAGRKSGDMIEITSGVAVTDSIAHNAQFMVDSESFIKVDNQ